MAFSKETRIQALTAAARHCCVCHRYKGVKIEVHHIVPVQAGGTDTVENAIALCFDCHADAGHYNAEHPRGTKFSPEELRLARETWHMAVRMNRTSPPKDKDSLYCRYLICKNFSCLKEIVEGDLSSIPSENPLLSNNFVHNFLTDIIKYHEEGHHRSFLWGQSFASKETYAQAYPNVRIFERPGRNLFPYFEATRVPSRDELFAQVAPSDALTSMLLDEGVLETEICSAFAYPEVCGGGGFQEIYRLRPVWSVFLAATNISDQPLNLNSLTCDIERPHGLGYRPFTIREEQTEENIDLPRMPLDVGATAIIPVATLLGPLEELPTKILSTHDQDLNVGEFLEISHCDADDLLSQLALIGPSIWPTAFKITKNGEAQLQELHQLDLSNIYIIGRHWAIGSCPHVFFQISKDSSLTYFGEIWALAPGIIQTSLIDVPADVCAIIISELEDESTYVREISINKDILFRDIILKTGETLRVPVEAGNCVSFTGYYIPHLPFIKRPVDTWQKNAIIANFLRSRIQAAH